MDIFRFFNRTTGTHFYTGSPLERDIVRENPSFSYEGPSFRAASSSDSQTNPVYRFFDRVSGTHFYTISPVERDSIINNFENYNFEGVAYEAFVQAQPDTIPLYRFYNTVTRTHFYTPSAIERDSLIDNNPNFNYEGVGYYVDRLLTFEEQVVELTNEERAKFGLSPLRLNRQLETSAENHSQNMAFQDFFSHTGQDGSSISDRARAAGYSFNLIGENIGVGYTTPEAVVEGWLNSPGHRENILNPNYAEIGVGYFFLENDTGNENWNHYWTQVFGRSSTTSTPNSQIAPLPTPETSSPPRSETIEISESALPATEPAVSFPIVPTPETSTSPRSEMIEVSESTPVATEFPIVAPTLPIPKSSLSRTSKSRRFAVEGDFDPITGENGSDFSSEEVLNSGIVVSDSMGTAASGYIPIADFNVADNFANSDLLSSLDSKSFEELTSVGGELAAIVTDGAISEIASAIDI